MCALEGCAAGDETERNVCLLPVGAVRLSDAGAVRLHDAGEACGGCGNTVCESTLGLRLGGPGKDLVGGADADRGGTGSDPGSARGVESLPRGVVGCFWVPLRSSTSGGGSRGASRDIPLCGGGGGSTGAS